MVQKHLYSRNSLYLIINANKKWSQGKKQVSLKFNVEKPEARDIFRLNCIWQINKCNQSDIDLLYITITLLIIG